MKVLDTILDELEEFVRDADEAEGVTRITFKTREEVMLQYDAVTAERIFKSAAVDWCPKRRNYVYSVPYFLDTFRPFKRTPEPEACLAWIDMDHYRSK